MSTDSVGPEYKCLHSVFRDSQSPSLWFSHVSWLTVQRGRDLLLLVSVGGESRALWDLDSQLPLDCVFQTNVLASPLVIPT